MGINFQTYSDSIWAFSNLIRPGYYLRAGLEICRNKENASFKTQRTSTSLTMAQTFSLSRRLALWYSALSNCISFFRINTHICSLALTRTRTFYHTYTIAVWHTALSYWLSISLTQTHAHTHIFFFFSLFLSLSLSRFQALLSSSWIQFYKKVFRVNFFSTELLRNSNSSPKLNFG